VADEARALVETMEKNTQQVQTITCQLAEIVQAFGKSGCDHSLDSINSRQMMKNIYENLSKALGHMQLQEPQFEQLEHALHALNEHFMSVAAIAQGSDASQLWPPLREPGPAQMTRAKAADSA
jgi:hypothetical protein